MAATSASNPDVIAKLVPGGVPSLAHVADQELLRSTRRLVGKSNQLFAALLLHLAEVEARGLHRKRLCASLYTYCIYELRFSEDAAARRSSAARLVKQFPPLFDAIANGELHLTGLLMLGPHLTPENHVDVLGRAKLRTKKEIAKLVRELSPLPLVPDLIEPLRSETAPLLATTRPSWEHLASSFEPRVRDLRPGERPREWANDGDGDALEANGALAEAGTPPPGEASPTSEPEPELLPATPVELPPITGPQQYQMQFTTSEEHVKLVERAKALLAREQPGLSLGEVHLEAMKLLVAALETRKFAVTDRPRKPAPASQPAEKAAAKSSDVAAQHTAADVGQSTVAPRRRGRYIPAAARREVFERDGGRCSYVDSRGGRCRETRYLELHHLKPFGRGGANLASNLTLRCGAHNALAAEEDFGREHIEQKRGEARHESLAAQADVLVDGARPPITPPDSA